MTPLIKTESNLEEEKMRREGIDNYIYVYTVLLNILLGNWLIYIENIHGEIQSNPIQ